MGTVQLLRVGGGDVLVGIREPYLVRWNIKTSVPLLLLGQLLQPLVILHHGLHLPLEHVATNELIPELTHNQAS